MKICFIMPTPFNIGGEQRVVSVIASLLQKNGHEVTILCKDKKIPINYSLYNLNSNVKIQFMKERNIIETFIKGFKFVATKLNNKTGILKNHPRILKNIVCDKEYIRKIENNIGKQEYNVVIGVGGYFSLLVSDLKNKNVKKIGWQHNSYDAYFKNKEKYYWNQEEVFKMQVQKLDNYIVLTNYDKKKIEKNWNIKCDTIYNPKSFESDKISNLEEKTFLAAGRLVYAKGFDNLIKAFEIFSKYNSEWNLKIVGNGKERTKLIKMINAMKLNERIKVIPATDNIQKYFLSSSALLLPSRWEGMPMIMIESLEMGVPIIAYEIPVVKEIIENNKDGLIVECDNVEKYANAMIKFAEESEKIKQLGKNAKIKANKFSHDMIINHWEKLIEKL